jgi:acyl-CoA dehydrogenase
MTEPEHAGSNPTELSPPPSRDGDDYVINGHKWFTTAADGAAFAIVMAVTNPDADRTAASQIIVPTDTPGFELVRNIPVMGDPGDGWGSHAEIGTRRPRAQGQPARPEGAGFLIAQERLGPGRIHHCMRWIGICERALELMCKRAATRELGNPAAPGLAPDRPGLDRREPRRDQRRPADGARRPPGRSTTRASTPPARRSRSSSSTSPTC